ncbi:MAG: TonB-dependent receptor [Longimicrobiales bacterium]
MNARLVGAGLLLGALLAALPTPASGQTPAAPARTGTVSGAVRGAFLNDVRPLAHAVVEVWGPGVRFASVADSLGQYSLDGLPAGPVRIRVSQTGHEPRVMDVIVPAGGAVLVDVELRARPVEMPALDVTGALVTVPDPDRRDVGPDARSVSEVEVAALEGGTGLGSSGLADAVRSLGGNDPGSATDVLFMRGSTTDMKLVLLDGAPVYTPFHVAGLLRSFEPEVLGRADLHVGGAPARFDGGLTSILDLRTRRPGTERIHASGSADLISATVAANGPLFPGTGFVASARSLHGLGEAPLGSSPYGYEDVLLSVESEPADGHLLKTTAFWNRESVVLDLLGSVGVQAAGIPDRASWANRAVSGTYRGRAGTTFVDVTVAGADYRATLPLQPSAGEGEEQPEPLMASAENRRFRAGVEAAHPTDRGVWRAGVAAERVEAAYTAVLLGTGQASLDSRAQAHTVGGYVDVSRTLAADVSLRAGLRADHFAGSSGGLRLAPRAALSWSVAPTALLTVAAGRYHQYARTSDTRVEYTLAAAAEGARGVGIQSDALLPVATADHVVVSLEQTLGRATRLGVEGFWKGFQGIHPDQDDPILSSGVDLRVQRQADGVTGWLGYGLSWFWSSNDLSGAGQEFTGRQLLTAGLSGRLGGIFGGEARVAYGAGLPYTSVPFRASDGFTTESAADNATEVLERASPLAGGPEDSFLRMDLELHALWRPDWGGRTWDVRPYVRILNALDRRDALFYAFQPWRGEGVTPLAERPLVPVIGVAWRF